MSDKTKKLGSQGPPSVQAEKMSGPSEENSGKVAAKKRNSGKKLSREALSLLNTAFVPEGERHGADTSPTRGAGEMATLQVKGRPPLPALVAKARSQDGNAPEQMARKADGRPGASNKRSAAIQPHDGGAGSLPKKPKRNSQPEGHLGQQMTPQAIAVGAAVEGNGGSAPTSGKGEPGLHKAGTDDGSGTIAAQGPLAGGTGQHYLPVSEGHVSAPAQAQANRKPAQGSSLPAKARKGRDQAAAPAPNGGVVLPPPDAAVNAAASPPKQAPPGTGKAALEACQPTVPGRLATATALPQTGRLEANQPPARASMEIGRRTSENDGSDGQRCAAAGAEVTGDGQRQVSALARPHSKLACSHGPTPLEPVTAADQDHRHIQPSARTMTTDQERASTGELRQILAGVAGAAGSSGSQRPQGQAAGAAVAAVDTGGARPLPVTGTTPVKAFVPIPIPRLDDVGRRERNANIELQRQLNEMRALYDELKATKIQELETVLAEQAEFADEQVRQLEHRARMWQAAAEAAEKKAQAAASQETVNRINELEVQNEQLRHEKAELLLGMAQKSREIALLQQALHDLRAQLQTAREPASTHAGSPDSREKAPGQGSVSIGAEGEVAKETVDNGAAKEPFAKLPVVVGSPSTARLAGAPSGCDPGPQLPSPSLGIGVQFPTPRVQLNQLQGALDSVLTGSAVASGGTGVSTACQRVVGLLPNLRMPTPSMLPQPHLDSSSLTDTERAPGNTGLQAIAGQRGQHQQRQRDVSTPTLAAMVAIAAAEPLPPSPGDSLQISTGVGVSTEMRRIVGMLPNLRLPTPSVEAVGSAPAAGGGNVFYATPHASVTHRMLPLTAACNSKDGNSTGSPIDGICDAVQQAATGTKTGEDVSLARGLGAPRSPQLHGRQDDGYSFVDLNPASAQKAMRNAPMSVLRAEAADAMGAVNCSLLQPVGEARSPLPGLPSTLAEATGTDAPIKSGSVASNQLSLAGGTSLLARAVAQHKEQQQLLVGASYGVPAVPCSQADQGASDCMRSPAQDVRSRPDSVPHGTPGASATGVPLQSSEAGATQAGQAGTRPGVSCSPSPRTARVSMFEQMLGWQVDVIASNPPTFHLTYKQAGVTFFLREPPDSLEGEAVDMASQDDQPQAAAQVESGYTFAPVAVPDSIAEKLPWYFKEEIEFSACQVRDFFARLDQSVKNAVALA